MTGRLAAMKFVLEFFVLLMVVAPAHAALILAVDSFNGTGFGQYPGINSVYGFEFRTNMPMTIIELGILDGGANGMATAHGIGIYSASGGQLASTTIPAGTAARLDGPYDPSGLLAGSGFRYVALSTPLSLQANTNYVIAAYYGVGSADEVAYSPAFTTNPAISYITSRYRYSGYPSGSGTFNSLVFPNANSPNREVVVDFTIEIPEPVMLSPLALGGLMMFRRRCPVA